MAANRQHPEPFAGEARLYVSFRRSTKGLPGVEGLSPHLAQAQTVGEIVPPSP